MRFLSSRQERVNWCFFMCIGQSSSSVPGRWIRLQRWLPGMSFHVPCLFCCWSHNFAKLIHMYFDRWNLFCVSLQD
jgi:hypothetical protein